VKFVPAILRGQWSATESLRTILSWVYRVLRRQGPARRAHVAWRRRV